jgi:MoaA/NifB/PqqE/SkfB family radical SAM enzyme
MRFDNAGVYRRILLSKRFFSSLWRSRQNILAAASGLPPVTGPYMAELDVTYRCDCCCQMCQRWQDKRKGEMTVEEYARLAEDFLDMGVHLVSIAGGEPLLREDIFSIINGFTRFKMAVNLCTNGHLLERYSEPITRSGISCITVSLDGATAETHEKIRGIDGSYAKIERGIRALLAHPPSQRPILRVRMTICGENVREVGAFYRKWHGLVDDVLLQPVHHCRDAFYGGPNKQIFHLAPELLLQQLAGTPFQKKGGYMHSLVLSIQKSGTFPVHRCYAGVLMARLDPWGNVYPCLEQHTAVGSVRTDNFSGVWNSEFFNRVRRGIAGNGKCKCWYNNTALLSHYAALLRRTSGRHLSEGLHRFNVYP